MLARIHSILQLVQAQGASDLHLVSGSPPMLRIHGELNPIEYEPLTSEVIVGLLAEIMTDEQLERYQALEEVDFAYEVPQVVRLRCNVYQQANGMAPSPVRAAARPRHRVNAPPTSLPLSARSRARSRRCRPPSPAVATSRLRFSLPTTTLPRLRRTATRRV